MTPLPTDQLLAALRWRYATKQYDPTKKIPPEQWRALEESLVLTPSSFGLQPWKFLVIDDPVTRAALVGASWGQTQPVEASHFVVFVVRQEIDEAHVDRYVERTAQVRGEPAASFAGFKRVMMGSVAQARQQGRLEQWSAHQLYIALGQFMASAALVGIDTTPMEGLQPAKYDEILGLTGTGWATVCACAAGYRAVDDKYAAIPKVRFSHAEVIEHR